MPNYYHLEFCKRRNVLHLRDFVNILWNCRQMEQYQPDYQWAHKVEWYLHCPRNALFVLSCNLSQGGFGLARAFSSRDSCEQLNYRVLVFFPIMFSFLSSYFTFRIFLIWLRIPSQTTKLAWKRKLYQHKLAQ